jgi:hypothetical protein
MEIKSLTKETADQARSLYLAGDFMAAAEAFAISATICEGEGNLLELAEMKNNQSVALLRARKPQEAFEAAKGTEKIFAEAGDNRRQGMALANQASALEALNRSKEAIELYNEAGDALEKASEFDSRFEVMKLLSSLYLRRLKIVDAILSLQAGLAAIKNPTPQQRFMKKLLFIRL